MTDSKPISTGPTPEEKRQLLKTLLSLRDGGPVPLGYGQQSLWFLSQIAPESPAYNFVFAADTRSSSTRLP